MITRIVTTLLAWLAAYVILPAIFIPFGRPLASPPLGVRSWW